MRYESPAMRRAKREFWNATKDGALYVALASLIVGTLCMSYIGLYACHVADGEIKDYLHEVYSAALSATVES